MASQARQWYRIENATSNPTIAEIHIVDVIGSWDDDWFARNFGYEMGVTARAFIEDLAKLPEAVKTIHLHINSPGGDVQGGVNIANALREQQLSKGRTVETYIDGLAASIASVIAMAGSKVVIGDNALMMIHNPWTIGIGDSAEMRKTADILDTIRGQIINTYKWHSSLDADAIIALMNAETWMDADQAIANGFATEKVEGLKVAASINPNAAAKLKVPDQYRDRVQAFLQPKATEPVKASAQEILASCKAAGCFDLAEELLAAGATIEQVTAKVQIAKQAKDAEASRVSTIRALCTEFTQPELAADYIAGGMPVDRVRAQLSVVRSKQDRVEIDAGINPDQGQARQSAGWKNAFVRVNRGSHAGARQ